MYTDGITESLNTEAEEFGEKRLIDILRGSPDDGAHALVRRAIGVASQFSNGNFADDVTVVALSVE